MNREKIAWLTSIVVIAMLAFQIPGTLAHRDDDYAFVKTLIDLHRQIDNNYVDPIEDSPALKAGVEPGDIITKVNGQSIQGLKIPDVQTKIKGPINSEVRLTVKHVNGQEVELKMRRQEIVLPTVKGFKRDPQNRWDYWASDNPKIAYVRITQFTSDTFTKLQEALEKVLPNG